MSTTNLIWGRCILNCQENLHGTSICELILLEKRNELAIQVSQPRSFQAEDVTVSARAMR